MVEGHRFEPGSLNVSVGATVTFTNDTDESHTVTAREGSLPDGADFFDSGGAPDERAAHRVLAEGLVGPGESYEVTFEVPGNYRYFCIPHESDGMDGVVVVGR